ncbi:cobalamin biosynthesis protein [Devosia sp. CAU 1758]
MIDDSVGHGPAQAVSVGSGIVAGLGLREQASIQDVLTLLDTCLALKGLDRRHIVALASMDRKAGHPALLQAAATLGLPLLSLPTSALSQAAPNPSRRVAVAIGLSSVAEAAALAFGPLLLEKQRGANVTCALSRYAPVVGRSSASRAASTLATSSAGP